jgi:hypothetical protein
MFIEDGRRLLVKIREVRLTTEGFAIAYSLDDGSRRTARLPLPLPVGGETICTGRFCRLELVDNGALIVGVYGFLRR